LLLPASFDLAAIDGGIIIVEVTAMAGIVVWRMKPARG
jgi:hypothetical protein